MKARQQHLKNLSKIFDLDLEFLKRRYTALKTMELSGHKLTERYCNGEIDCDHYKKQLDMFKNNISEFFKNAKNREAVENILFNGDPRGYFLKLRDDYLINNNLKSFIQTDWGGYGILCPEDI